MPLYEYQCEDCGERFERIRKFSDPPLDERCPKCGGPIRKLISSPAIQFKGKGWYVTDYAKTTAGSADSEASADAKSDAKKEGKSESAPSSEKDKTEKSEKTETPKSAASTPVKAEKPNPG